MPPFLRTALGVALGLLGALWCLVGVIGVVLTAADKEWGASLGAAGGG